MRPQKHQQVNHLINPGANAGKESPMPPKFQGIRVHCTCDHSFSVPFEVRRERERTVTEAVDDPGRRIRFCYYCGWPEDEYEASKGFLVDYIAACLLDVRDLLKPVCDLTVPVTTIVAYLRALSKRHDQTDEHIAQLETRLKQLETRLAAV